MSEVKRYDVLGDSDGGYIDQAKDGRVVLYTDYAALEAECERLRVDAARWNKCKAMRKEWWFDAVAEAGRKGGRSLDDAIDAALSAKP